MKTSHALLGATFLLLVAATPVVAQTGLAGNDWRYGSTLNLLGGVNTGQGETGGIAGAGIGWELTPWFGVEGTGAWLIQNEDDGFAADLKAMAGWPSLSGLMPYVSGGVGLYRVARPEPATEPSFIVGGGVNVQLSRHIALRPEIETRIVMGDSDTFPMTTFGVRFAYHFEDHPITPQRTRP